MEKGSAPHTQVRQGCTGQELIPVAQGGAAVDVQIDAGDEGGPPGTRWVPPPPLAPA